MLVFISSVFLISLLPEVQGPKIVFQLKINSTVISEKKVTYFTFIVFYKYVIP